MADYFPILFAILLVTLAFAHAVRHGVVRLLASAIAATAAFAVLFSGFNLLPGLSDSAFRSELTWPWVFGLSLGAALVCYVVVLLVGLWILKLLFARDSWLHWMGHGLVGGLLSLFPSAVAVFFLFWCVRVGGTLIELNYAALVSRPGIENYAGGIRPMPFPARWRDSVESLPFVATIFDAIDPFSNRVHRNAAALAVMHRSPALLAFLVDDPEVEPLLSSPKVRDTLRDAGVADRILGGDRVGLALHPDIRALGEDRDLARDFRRLRPRALLARFASFLEAASLDPRLAEPEEFRP